VKDNPEVLSTFEADYLAAVLRVFPLQLRAMEMEGEGWAACYDKVGRVHLGPTRAAAEVAAAHDLSVLCAVLLGGHLFSGGLDL
jgi:hypothetical protein